MAEDEPDASLDIGEAAGASPALPSREALLGFLRENPRALKREIASAFGLKGADRVALKRMLRALETEGALAKEGRRLQAADAPPPVLLLVVGEIDADGEATAEPAVWDRPEPRPRIVMGPARAGEPALGPGDRFLGRLSPLAPGGRYAYEARVVKRLGRVARRVLGVFEAHERGAGHGGRVLPIEKGDAEAFVIDPGAQGAAQTGELVEIEPLPGRRRGLRRARVIERLGDPTAPRAISMIAIHEHGIPIDFSDAALAEAEAARPLAGLEGRVDLRPLPLVTIDPEDARDHDDAVAAAPDDDPKNPGGWVVWVAIADVAQYVRPGTALDAAARERGNSAYFPDRVAPMLPDRLSGDLCSLHEGVDRPCLTARLTLDARGAVTATRFVRGVMRSRASLTYELAQAIWDGEPSAAGVSGDVAEGVRTLFRAYHAAASARDRRSPLDLDLPERKVILAEDGTVAAIRFRDRFEAHRLIEEFMILANVAAAEALEAARTPLLYRVHEEPNPEKIEALREILGSIDVPLAKGQVMTPRLLNRALDQARETPHAELVNMAVLRSQTQAYYAPRNLGHFGLALRSYGHFTSPIRRYADLVVHRALIAALRLGGEGGHVEAEIEALSTIGDHVSMTERRAMAAERDTTDRYLAAYLADKGGGRFEGKISGVQPFGLFVKLDDTGADGFVPISRLGDEFFRYDEAGARLVGARSGVELRLGQKVTARLIEATPVTGGLLLELLDLPSARRGGGGARPGPRAAVKPGAARPKNAAEMIAARDARRASREKVAKAKAAAKAARAAKRGKPRTKR